MMFNGFGEFGLYIYYENTGTLQSALTDAQIKQVLDTVPDSSQLSAKHRPIAAGAGFL